MPRACVIVLDAVGAGELPDAAEYGDQGSDTLGNVARAVRGLDLPNLEALGLGNIERLIQKICEPIKLVYRSDDGVRMLAVPNSGKRGLEFAPNGGERAA